MQQMSPIDNLIWQTMGTFGVNRMEGLPATSFTVQYEYDRATRMGVGWTILIDGIVYVQTRNASLDDCVNEAVTKWNESMTARRHEEKPNLPSDRPGGQGPAFPRHRMG